MKHQDFNTLLIIVEDGSSDGSREKIEKLKDNTDIDTRLVDFLFHDENKGYGQALLTGFRHALKTPAIKKILTMDCDKQHQPNDIERFFNAPDKDIVSGSRYLEDIEKGIEAPRDRQKINRRISQKYRERSIHELGSEIPMTDAFCGMKLYHRRVLDGFVRAIGYRRPDNTLLGYGFPLLFWNYYIDWMANNDTNPAESFTELAIPRIYITDDRTFGENLDFPLRRYRYYMKCMKTLF